MENTMEKSCRISEKIRKEGNKLYCQKHHNKDIHRNILWIYSKSIAFAPKDSEHLAAAYSNRSVLLMHIGRYEESIVDIDRALEISKSQELLLKLVARKAKIVNSIEDMMKTLSLNASDKEKDNEMFCISKPSKVIPCASESILLKYNETFGRHYVAARDINPGEIIIVEESYICIPKNNLRYIVCSHCLIFTWNGIPCDTCPFNIYCSEDCKKEAWQDYHEIECLITPYLTFLQSEKNECVMSYGMIALRTFVKAVRKEGLDTVLNVANAIDSQADSKVKGMLTEGVLQNDKFRSCYNLSSNVRYNNEENKLGIYITKHLIDLLLTKTKIFDEKKDSLNCVKDTFITQLMIIFNTLGQITDINAFSYQGNICQCPDSNGPTICKCGSNRGAVIAPCCSLINHSCCANVSRLFFPKKKVVLFTLTSVKKGEQLCDSYGPSIRMETQIRQRILEKNFHFSCKCIACTENWPDLSKLQLLIDIRTESITMYQVIYEFKKLYPKENELFIYQDPKDIWGINKKALQKAKLTCALIFKYSRDYKVAFVLCNPYRYFIDKVYAELYGEKCAIPDACA